MNNRQRTMRLLVNPTPADLLNVCYGHASTAFGPCVLVWSAGGVLALWLDTMDSAPALAAVSARFGVQRCVLDDEGAQRFLDRALSSAPSHDFEEPLTVCVRGSAFEIQVWHALCEIPFGARRSYGELAASIGKPKAARAVGSAVARNNVGYLIPCHRVVRQSGETGQFRWGDGLKRHLIEWESTQ